MISTDISLTTNLLLCPFLLVRSHKVWYLWTACKPFERKSKNTFLCHIAKTRLRVLHGKGTAT